MDKDDLQMTNLLINKGEFKEPFDQEMVEINESIEKLEFERASILLKKKLENQPNNVHLIDTLSEVMMNLDDTEAAMKLLKKSISLEPNKNGEKYMTLGQIGSDYKQTLKMYQKGVSLFLDELNEEKTKNINSCKIISINESVACAYAAIAELYMNSDLWYE